MGKCTTYVNVRLNWYDDGCVRAHLTTNDVNVPHGYDARVGVGLDLRDALTALAGELDDYFDALEVVAQSEDIQLAMAVNRATFTEIPDDY